MTNQGWVSIHRRITDWEWYHDANTFRLFFHLLMLANHADGKWKGIDVNTGQLITGRKKLAAQLALSEQQIRTSLNKLKSTNEITIKASSEHSMISITNWSLYQGGNQQPNQPATNEQPTSNQQVTTNNNENNVNNDNKRDVATKVADCLANKILTEQPNAKLNPESWVKDIDKAIRIDKRTEQELISIIDWMYTGDQFWSGVVLSGKKLREKYDAMIIQKQRNGKRTTKDFSETDYTLGIEGFETS